mmetsp:Transcript_10063/g.29658  ORF Transcript_10063/g.29658 Transcript_10063/m.29658 type:complete len:399 (-) Transcript_10063:1045-2241(-)
MAFKVEVHALAEALLAQQRGVHADHLGALLVDRGGVEVVHGHVALGADGVRQGTRVLRKLARAQHTHVADALHRLRAHVRGEGLVAVDREALLERELEPVAAGDAVARPVVEVLVRHHPLHPLVVRVRGGPGPGEHAGGVEDVEALVLHGAHVEVVHRHHVEEVQVVLAAVDLLVPLHGALEAVHCVVEGVHVLLLAVDVELHGPPGHGAERVRDVLQVARDEGEEVGGLGEGVLPRGEVRARAVSRLVLARGHAVAVGQQHGEGGGAPRHAHRVLAHHVGAVLEEGDAAEALRLALGAEHGARVVEAGELRVGARLVLDRRLHLEGLALRERGALHRQRALLQHVVGGGERRAVHAHAQKLQVLAVQHQVRARARALPGVHVECGDHLRLVRAEGKV